MSEAPNRSLGEIEQELFLTVGPHWRMYSSEELADMTGYKPELVAIVRAGSQERLRQYRARNDLRREIEPGGPR